MKTGQARMPAPPGPNTRNAHPLQRVGVPRLHPRPDIIPPGPPPAFPDRPMKIVKYPHPALRTQCRPVTAIDKDVQMAAAAMLDLMYSHEGLGLAAPQCAL